MKWLLTFLALLAGTFSLQTAAELPTAVKDLQIPQAHQPQDNLLTSGQITREQMSALRGMGYTTFISLRPATEQGAGWEEVFAGAEGIHFTRIPIAGTEDLTPEKAALLGKEMGPAGARKVVLYCASGNRVGALLAVKAHAQDGLSAERALQLGLDAGLTRLEPAVRTLLGLPPK